jgi:hypothetical protein
MIPGPLITLAVVVTAAAAACTIGAWIGTRRAARARRQAAVCDRDVPHDRVTLSPGERAAWKESWAWFELEAEAEEQARLKAARETEQIIDGAVRAHPDDIRARIDDILARIRGQEHGSP